jgi:hypothetical protein
MEPLALMWFSNDHSYRNECLGLIYAHQGAISGFELPILFPDFELNY